MDNSVVTRLPVLACEDLGFGDSATGVDIDGILTNVQSFLLPSTITMLAVMLQPLIRLWRQNKQIKLKGMWPHTSYRYHSMLIQPFRSPSLRTVDELLSVPMSCAVDPFAAEESPAEQDITLRDLLGFPLVAGSQVVKAFSQYRHKHRAHLEAVYRASQHMPIGVAEVGDEAARLVQLDIANNDAEVRVMMDESSVHCRLDLMLNIINMGGGSILGTHP